MAEPTHTVRNRLTGKERSFALGPAAPPRELLGLG
jgi:hypothetical protein